MRATAEFVRIGVFSGKAEGGRERSSSEESSSEGVSEVFGWGVPGRKEAVIGSESLKLTGRRGR